MARETAAQRNARLESERQAQLAQEVAEYPRLLLWTLEEATQKSNFELTVKNSEFVLMDRDSPRDNPVALTMLYSQPSQRALETLEWELQSKANERAEQKRRYEVKQAALAKLNKEERELLNL